MNIRRPRVLLWTLIGLVVVNAGLMVFNIYATFELAAEASDLKDTLLAAAAE